MSNRRTFIMTALGAVAVGAVALITSQLRSSDIRIQASKEPSPPTPKQKPPLESPSTPFKPDLNATQVDSPTPETTPAITGVCPPVITRQEWGALAPNLNATGEHGLYDAITNPDGWLVYDQPLQDILITIVVHHSALPLNNGPREIQALHMHDKGFADVGYQFIIDDQGRLYEGRAITVRGAHTYGHNYGTVGICLIGNFEEIHPTASQINTLREQIHCLVDQYPKIRRIAGHRDYNPTQTLCPGNHLAELLPNLAAEQDLLYGA